MGQFLWYIFKYFIVDLFRIIVFNVSFIYNLIREYILQKIVMFINDSSYLWFLIVNIRIILLVYVIRYKFILFVWKVFDGSFGLIFQVLCRIIYYNFIVFQSVIDIVGMIIILFVLFFGIIRIQQFIVIMFGVLIVLGQSLNRVVQDKVFLIFFFIFIFFVKVLIYNKCIFKF